MLTWLSQDHLLDIQTFPQYLKMSPLSYTSFVSEFGLRTDLPLGFPFEIVRGMFAFSVVGSVG